MAFIGVQQSASESALDNCMFMQLYWMIMRIHFCAFPSTHGDVSVQESYVSRVRSAGTPINGVFLLLLASAAGTTSQASPGSNAARLAGSPGAIGRPCRSAIPAMAAGFHDMAATTSTNGMSRWARATPKCGFEAEHPGGRLVERHLLRLGHVRSMVGGNGVDRAVSQALAHRHHVLDRAQRRVDLVQRAVRRQQFVGQADVVRRGLGGDRQAIGFGRANEG